MQFMTEHLKSNYGDPLSVNEGEHAELEFLRTMVPQLKKELAGKDTSVSDSDSSEDNEQVGDLQ